MHDCLVPRPSLFLLFGLWKSREKQGRRGLTHHMNATRQMQGSMYVYTPMIPPSRYWKGTELVYEQLAKRKVNASCPFV